MNIYDNIITHQKLSSSAQEQRVLLSYGEQYYEASPAMAELVEELQQHATEEEAIAAYTKKKAGKYTPEQVRMIIDKFITPLFAQEGKKHSFLYEKELFSAEAIDKFSDTFRFLFNRGYMLTVFLVAVSLDAWFFLRTPDLLLFNNKVNVYLVVGLFAFMLGSSFFHELGHASACKFFGVRHGGIGFGLYLNFPVLYTDVTEVWKLKRGERCVVNLAGVYFQSWWLIILLDDGKRYLALSDSGHESWVCNDPESFLQVRRILDGIRPAGGAQPAAAFFGTAWLYMEEITQRAGKQAALPLANPSVRAIRTACLFGSSQSFYGILFPVCHSDFPIPVRTDFSRCGERADSLPVEPDDAAVCLAA